MDVVETTEKARKIVEVINEKINDAYKEAGRSDIPLKVIMGPDTYRVLSGGAQPGGSESEGLDTVMGCPVVISLSYHLRIEVVRDY